MDRYRHAIVCTMLYSSMIAIYIGSEHLDFVEEFCSDECPFDLILDSDAIRSRENYMKLVRDNENHDVHGNKGEFEMGHKFTIGIIADADEGLSIDQFYESIPHADKMQLFVVDEQ